ncbi:hypothetical protein C2G38_2173660 [Gigaspora rosea]|uniref:Uncharacterized protein n=1 Tax=Gigaspora rosea TaxID=44941 RepID=A0A397VNN1_9GLOM|nr:hypothetical protein C2G38_2173660 [Gigaspora rosea]
MADTQETKLKYHQGTCFNYKRTSGICPPKIALYNYSLSLKEAFSFSLCFRCNSTLLKLSSKAKKSKAISSFVKTKAITSSVKSKAISNSVVTTTDNLSKLESYDFTIPVNNTIEFEEKDKKVIAETNIMIMNLLRKEGYARNKYDDYEHSNDELLSDKKKEYEYNYGIFIKIENSTAFPAKWYTSKIFTVDELLSEIHQNIEVLTKRNPIEPGTDYWKYTSKNINMAFFITFISSTSKQSITNLELNDALDNDININFKNNNSIPKTSNLLPSESLVAKNVLDICKENHCLIHNRFKAMASPTELSLHSLFVYKHQSKKRRLSILSSASSFSALSSPILLQVPSPPVSFQVSSPLALLQVPNSNVIQYSNFLQQPIYPGQYYISPSFYNPYMSYFLLQIYGSPFQLPIRSPLQPIIKSTMKDFLKYKINMKILKTIIKDFYQNLNSKKLLYDCFLNCQIMTLKNAV